VFLVIISVEQNKHRLSSGFIERKILFSDLSIGGVEVAAVYDWEICRI
jgi:hypothetical protein